ncbi:MAG TPA: ribbon-helix-helix domain-containing protein [Caulobacteraceae bacterium]|jgi:predicted transcriptional regulator
MSTRVVTAHIPVELAERIDAVAERHERPRGWIVKQALKAWLDEEDLRERLTREGLAALDTGDVVEHDGVKAWADSLPDGPGEVAKHRP